MTTSANEPGRLAAEASVPTAVDPAVREALEEIAREIAPLVYGRCSACKRTNVPSGCTISDDQCGDGRRCEWDMPKFESVAKRVLDLATAALTSLSNQSGGEPSDVPTDEDRIAYWKGAYDRMAARTIQLSRQIEAAASLTPSPEADREGVIAEIKAERRCQVEAEGWTPEHDDKHEAGQMAGAAACYALADIMHWQRKHAIDQFWPWDNAWWKPGDRRRNLVKAGALIVAEIERLDRAAAPALTTDQGTGERVDG